MHAHGVLLRIHSMLAPSYFYACMQQICRSSRLALLCRLPAHTCDGVTQIILHQQVNGRAPEAEADKCVHRLIAEQQWLSNSYSYRQKQ
jgi:hypothetical protein